MFTSSLSRTVKKQCHASVLTKIQSRSRRISSLERCFATGFRGGGNRGGSQHHTEFAEAANVMTDQPLLLLPAVSVSRVPALAAARADMVAQPSHSRVFSFLWMTRSPVTSCEFVL